MDRDKAIQELHDTFMARTELDTISWAARISKELMEALSMSLGVGYDLGRHEIYYTHNKVVVQLDDYGNIVNTYSSINLAASSMEGDSSNIRACLSEKQHTAYGYHWKLLSNLYNKTEEEESNELDQ
jgi:hypothetical protein